MAKREIVALNESVPQLQVPQSGDTYQLCRDVYLTTGVLKSEVADGASAVGVVLDTENSFASSGSKLVSIRNAGTEKAAITKDGNLLMDQATGKYISMSEGTAYFGIVGNNSYIRKGGSSFHLVGHYGDKLEITGDGYGGNNAVAIGATSSGVGCITFPNSVSGSPHKIRQVGKGSSDQVLSNLEISVASAGTAATVNTTGASIKIIAGDGASGGNGDGGNLYLTPGTGYGTGHHGYIIAANLPTSASGLPAGAIWNNSGVLNVA